MQKGFGQARWVFKEALFSHTLIAIPFSLTFGAKPKIISATPRFPKRHTKGQRGVVQRSFKRFAPKKLAPRLFGNPLHAHGWD